MNYYITLLDEAIHPIFVQDSVVYILKPRITLQVNYIFKETGGKIIYD